jgi:cephalosporin hydroxylase
MKPDRMCNAILSRFCSKIEDMTYLRLQVVMTAIGRSLLQEPQNLAAYQQLLFSSKLPLKWQEFGKPVQQHPAIC